MTIALSDATAKVLQSLRAVPTSPPSADRRGKEIPSAWPPRAWHAERLWSPRYIADPPLKNGALDFTRFLVLGNDPDTEEIVLEVTGVKQAPRLIAVSWPRSVPRTPGAAPTPFLVYFRPGVAQNAPRNGGKYYEGPGLGSYPFGFDYVTYGLWYYVRYNGDPVTEDPSTKGLPYQIRAADKKVVLVVPLNRVPGAKERVDELGDIMNADTLQTVLLEIQKFMFARAGTTSPPGRLGRTAMAAFSSGNTYLHDFLARARRGKSAFYHQVLKELYLFEPPSSSVVAMLREIERWRLATASRQWGDKCVRIYTQDLYEEDLPQFRRLFDPRRPDPIDRARPFVADDPGYATTLAHLPVSVWAGPMALAPIDDKMTRAQQEQLRRDHASAVHQVIPATLLTDALRKSKLP